MATRNIGETGIGFVDSTGPLSSTPEKVTLADIQSLQASVDSLVSAINGNLSFGNGSHSSRLGNFDAQVFELLSPATPDEEFAVPHGLRRRPWGFTVLMRDRTGTLYGSRLGSWTDKITYFKCDAANVPFLIALI